MRSSGNGDGRRRARRSAFAESPHHLPSARQAEGEEKLDVLHQQRVLDRAAGTAWDEGRPQSKYKLSRKREVNRKVNRKRKARARLWKWTEAIGIGIGIAIAIEILPKRK